MKNLKVAVFISIIITSKVLYADDASEIVAKADSLRRGITSQAVMTMQIIRPAWSRTIKLKIWEKNPDKALVYIEAPAKEKGQTFLKMGTEMWNWLPSIARLVKIPASMMAQSWMGSDYTNDDLMKESSIIRDYSHSITGIDTVDGMICKRIESVPNADAAVVWGKLVLWITEKNCCVLRIEHYDEDGSLVNIEHASGIKKFNNRDVVTHIEIIPEEKPGNKTIIDLENLEFDKAINENFFSQQNMKQIR